MNRQFDFSDPTLRALAYELKYPLVNIARRAELGDLAALEEVQQTAEEALRLIDGYLLSTQTEYGQLMLDMEPATLGSVLYDASVQLRNTALEAGCELIIDDRVHDPVMTHRSALTSLITMFGSTIIGLAGEKHLSKQLVLRGFKTAHNKLGVGVFSRKELLETDLRTAVELQGRAHLPLARVTHGSQVTLAIADNLCSALGGKLEVKRMGSLNGLVTELPRSDQLAFV